MYLHVFVGGTFDGLHLGHVAVLTDAFREAEKVTIGLTSDEFVKNFKIKTLNFKIENSLKISNSKLKIRSHVARKQALERWIIDNKFKNRTHIIPIDDPYEPAVSGDFDALIVTCDNRQTGEEINRRRKAKGLNEFVLIDIPLVRAQDHAPISSTRVRNGEIETNGKLIMPQSLIPALRKPLGRIVQGKDLRDLIKDLRGKDIITVGDQTTKTFLDLALLPDLAIVDGKVGRKPFHDAINMLQPEKVSPFQATRVKSGPGYMSRKAIQAVKAVLAKQAKRVTLGIQVKQEKKTRQATQGTQGTQVGQGTRARQARREKYVIVVEGEEDLLALPAILYAPIGSVVLYGQPASPDASQGGPREGIVMLDINQNIKNLVQKLMKKFLVSK